MTYVYGALIAGLVIAMLIKLGRIAARRRLAYVQAMTRIAEQHGLRFEEEKDRDVDELYPQIKPFQQGSNRRTADRLLGELEVEGHMCRFLAGKHSYDERDSDGDTSTTTFRFVLVHLPWQTHDLEIRAEHFADRLSAMLGFDDIDFESEEFSRAFFVTSADKRFAYDVLHGRTMEFLLANRPHRLQIVNGVLFLRGNYWAPDEFAATIDWTKQFCALWPRHLRETAR